MSPRSDRASTSPAGRQLSVVSGAAITTALFVAVLWAVQIIDSLSHYRLLSFGIVPRTPGILV